MACALCGFAPEPAHRFCAMCGGRLERAEPAERRSLTVVFCDLVGSTELSARLDPEELRELVRRYQRAAALVVERRDGYIAQYLGDGLLIYFGYPRAHEDDAHRAVSAALELLESLPEGLQVRVGVHSGPVVVGEMGGGWRRERLAIGDVPNVAARLQSLAEPGSVVASAATEQLCGDRFQVESLGSLALKGIPTPVPAYRVLAPREGPARLAPTPFVGRAPELARLDREWQAVRAGSFRMLEIVGDAGMGKSRLVRTFCERVTGPVLLASCSAYASDHALFPVKEWLRGAGLPPGPAELVELLQPEPSGPGLELERLLERVVAFLRAFCQAAPAVLVMEDAHWADPSTRKLLERLEGLGALVLVASRTPIGAGSTLALSPLEPADLEVLLEGVPEAPELAARCDGNPLFAEELARAARAGQRSLPTSLQGLLLSRLDALRGSRRVAQVASVIGRHFPVAVLDRLWGGSPDLSELVAAGIMECWEDQAGFRHALMQEAAYQTLLHRDRRELHGQLARLLESELGRSRPEMLAHHFQAAGEAASASRWWEEAARHAASRGANAEALRHLDRALGDGQEPERELSLLSQRIAPLMASEGYASQELARIAARAQELSRPLASPPFAALRGLWAYLLVRSRLEEAEELAGRLGALAGSGGREWRVEAELALGITAAHRLDLARAETHLARALSLGGSGSPLRFGQDPVVLGRTHRGWILALQGRHQEAREELRRARSRARSHPFSLILAWVMSAVALELGADPRATRRAATRARELCREHASRHWEGLALGLEGWARCRLGEGEEGLQAVREGYRMRQETGARLSLSHLKLLEALCLRELDRVEEARECAREGLALACELGQPAYRARLEELATGETASEH